MSVTIYAARKMSGLGWPETYLAAVRDRCAMLMRGIKVEDPVVYEAEDLIRRRGELPDHAIGSPSYGRLEDHWRRDKEMIRRAHVFVDFSAGQKSEGVAHEMGYARYFLWMPVVRIFRKAPADGIHTLEDDVIATSVEQAAYIINERWGTRWKRLKWRAAMFARCWPKAVWRRLLKWS